MSMARSAQWPLIMKIGAMLLLPILVGGLRKFTQICILGSRRDLLNTMTIGPTAVYMLARTWAPFDFGRWDGPSAPPLMLLLPILVRGLQKFTLLCILGSRRDLLNTMTIGLPAVYMLARTWAPFDFGR
jgi:hypothetical protein